MAPEGRLATPASAVALDLRSQLGAASEGGSDVDSDDAQMAR